ncbi:MAG: hypothetical protein J3Q66DRAFT_185012 [Benniella sp.]|nr:MAG: hypothetical protein J3Q66DRAFT_185012 [Benniella sp.]
MVYRGKRPGGNDFTFHMLCPPAQKALLQLFKSMPLSKDIRKCLEFGINLNGEQFKRALFHQLLHVRNPKPILLTATDLNNKNQQTISLDFDEWDTIKPRCVSLGPGCKKTLSRGYEGYPRFDYMLGPIFIQASVSDLQRHNTDSTIGCYKDDVHIKRVLVRLIRCISGLVVTSFNLQSNNRPSVCMGG